MLLEVVTQKPVEHGRVGDVEVALNLLRGHPCVQGAARVDVVADGGLLEGTAVPVVGRPQVVGEVRQCQGTGRGVSAGAEVGGSRGLRGRAGGRVVAVGGERALHGAAAGEAGGGRSHGHGGPPYARLEHLVTGKLAV
jgi:hypothetical protein